MKLICIGDIHFKASEYVIDKAFFLSLVKKVQSLKPTAIILMGDILDQHERLHILPHNLACNLIKRLLKIAPLYIIIGNHDFATNTEFQTENHWLAPWKKITRNLHIIDRAQKHEIGGVPFMFCPYVYPGRFAEALDTSGADWRQNVAAVFGHQEIRGVKMGVIRSIDGDVWEDNYPLLITGHIHERHQLQDNVYYTGSSKVVSFSGENNISIVDFSTDGIEIDHAVLTNIPRKISITHDLADVSDLVLPSCENNGDILRLALTGTSDEFKTFKKTALYKTMIKNGVKIALRMRQVERAPNATTEYDFTELLNRKVDEMNNPLVRELLSAILADF